MTEKVETGAAASELGRAIGALQGAQHEQVRLWEHVMTLLSTAERELAAGRPFSAYALVHIAARYEYELTASADCTSVALDALEDVTNKLYAFNLEKGGLSESDEPGKEALIKLRDSALSTVAYYFEEILDAEIGGEESGEDDAEA